VITGTVCFKQKTNICNVKLEDLGVNGSRGSKFLVENVIWNRRLWFAYSLCIFYGAMMMINGTVVYSWMPPLLSIFGRKMSPFLAKIWWFWGINQGLTLNLSFITPKGTSLHDFTSFELSRVKIHQLVWPVCESQKKGINK